MFILNDLLIELVHLHFLLPMCRLQHIDKVVRELLAVVLDVLLGILPNQQHLPDVTLALYVTILIISPFPRPTPVNPVDSPFEPVLVSHLSFTCLTIPAQPPKAFLFQPFCQLLSPSLHI